MRCGQFPGKAAVGRIAAGKLLPNPGSVAKRSLGLRVSALVLMHAADVAINLGKFATTPGLIGLVVEEPLQPVDRLLIQRERLGRVAGIALAISELSQEVAGKLAEIHFVV